jgi:hypothetical protein
MKPDWHPLVIPSAKFGPVGIRFFADILDASIEWCAENGIVVPESGRQRIGVLVLREWAEAWEAGTRFEPTDMHFNAMGLAYDLRYVMHVTPDGLPNGLRETITRVTRGTLEETGDQQPYNAQVELFVAMWAQFAGFQIGSPEPPRTDETPANARPTSRPEFVLLRGGDEYVAEVKRPESIGGAKRCTVSAAKQMRRFRANLPCLVFLDVGRALIAEGADRNADEPRIRAAMHRVADAIQGQLHSPQKAGDLSHTVLIITFARRQRRVLHVLGVATYMPVIVIDNPSAFGGVATVQIADIHRALKAGADEFSLDGVRQF